MRVHGESVRVRVSGSRVRVSGFRVKVSGFRVIYLGYRVRVSGAGGSDGVRRRLEIQVYTPQDPTVGLCIEQFQVATRTALSGPLI